MTQLLKVRVYFRDGKMAKIHRIKTLMTAGDKLVARTEGETGEVVNWQCDLADVKRIVFVDPPGSKVVDPNAGI